MQDDILNKIKDNPGTIIDMHTHTGVNLFNIANSFYPSIQGLRDLVTTSRACGVDYLTTFPMPWPYYYAPPLLARGQTESVLTGLEDYPYELSNRLLLYEVGLFGENVLPFLVIDPRCKVKKQQWFIENTLQTDKIYGLKLHTTSTSSRATDLRGTAFLEIAERHDLPLIIHTGSDEISHARHVLELAESHPQLRLCIAHASWFSIEVLNRLERTAYPNVFLDAAPFVLLCQYYRTRSTASPGATDRLGFPIDLVLQLDYADPQKSFGRFASMFRERLLWGTDHPFTLASVPGRPHPIGGTYQMEKELLDTLPDDLRKQIARDNPLRFLGG